MIRAAGTVLSLLVAAGGAYGADLPADPLRSPMWADMATRYLPGGTIEFDDRVRVVVPSLAENQAQVPVTVDARALPGIARIVVFADLNPIQHVLTLTPRAAQPYVSFRMKVEQGTPIRAAAQTADGVWHVGGLLLEAAGGGCSAPAMARRELSWSDTVGEAQGRLWPEANGTTRARFRVRHPMDTGLAKDGTPAFFIERLELKAGSGSALATVELYEPVSEDPTLTLLLDVPRADRDVTVDGRDNNGNIYRSTITKGWKESALPAAAESR